MATVGAIAAMRDDATKSLKASAETLAGLLGVPVPQLPEHYRDRDYLHADQLRVLAGFMVDVVEAVQARPAAELVEDDIELGEGINLSEITKAQLQEELDALGVEYPARASKADLLALWEAHDGADSE